MNIWHASKLRYQSHHLPLGASAKHLLIILLRVGEQKYSTYPSHLQPDICFSRTMYLHSCVRRTAISCTHFSQLCNRLGRKISTRTATPVYPFPGTSRPQPPTLLLQGRRINGTIATRSSSPWFWLNRSCLPIMLFCARLRQRWRCPGRLI